MSVILQDISKVSQVNNISSPKPSLILPRGFTHSPTSQQQNLSIKIDTTTQEYHCDDQRLRDGSIGVSISFVPLSTFDFYFIFLIFRCCLLNEMLHYQQIFRWKEACILSSSRSGRRVITSGTGFFPCKIVAQLFKFKVYLSPWKRKNYLICNPVINYQNTKNFFNLSVMSGKVE